MEIIYHGNDKYNRDLAEIFVNGENIAKTMLKNGYGWVYRGGIEPSNYAELLQIENSLKGSNIGLWASNTCSGERKAVTKTENIISVKPTISTIPAYIPSNSNSTNTSTNTSTETEKQTYFRGTDNSCYYYSKNDFTKHFVDDSYCSHIEKYSTTSSYSSSSSSYSSGRSSSSGRTCYT